MTICLLSYASSSFSKVVYSESIDCFFSFNPFNPEFLKWTLPSLNLDTSIVANSKINNWITNDVDPDEMAHYEPSHLDLHCLQRYLYWSKGMKELKETLFQKGKSKFDICLC